MTDEQSKLPDHTLKSAKIEAGDDPPMVFAVTDLRAYVKPEPAEELGDPNGGLADFGTEVTCTCVPVSSCACNSVGYYTGGSPCSHCPCQCTGTCSRSCLPYYYL